jgi:hypothetical protein
MHTYISDYYRLPYTLGNSLSSYNGGGNNGFFRFGSAAACYGHCTSGLIQNAAGSNLYDASQDVRFEKSEVHLPFDAGQVIDNLRKERYTAHSSDGQRGVASGAVARKAYYSVRKLLPVVVRRYLQRFYLKNWRDLPFPHWPVDVTVDALHQELLRLTMQANGIQRIPFIWFWPEGAQSCLIMTHDVETAAGRDFVPRLMDLDDSFGFKSSFQVVPEERYTVPDTFVNEIRARGFEFNIHDLNHDGHLFRELGEFRVRARKINDYARRYEAQGFRAGAMYRNQEWFDAFEFSYDMSVPNVAHLEPHRGGCCTVMPYFVGRIVEIPLTATQDYSLFHVLNDYSIDLWKKQLAIIQEKNGLMSFIVHPDYVISRKARKVYEGLLHYLREMVPGNKVWAALPRDVDRWWRARSQMKLVPDGTRWSIEGPEKEKARVAYAVLEGDRLRYDLA